MINKAEVLENIRRDVYLEFFDDDYSNLYLRRNWIFPNHIDVMIEISNKLCDKYGGDKYICEIAIILHDVGLVYKRNEGSSPVGHESRSLEYSRSILEKYKLSQDVINEVLDCVIATDKKSIAKSINEKIVVSCDVMAHLTSVHYFAKSLFYEDWDKYVKWFENKITKSIDNIAFDDEREELRPICEHFLNAIDIHKRMMRKYSKK